MKLMEYADREMLAMDVANMLASELRAALQQRDTVTFAVPGGTTPGPVFDSLCGVKLEWDRVHVILTDERWVPESNDQSNAALIRGRLFKDQAAAPRFTPYFSAESTIDAVAANLSEKLSDGLPIDVLLLGMGADMHTASLFPGADGLAAALAPDAPMFVALTLPGQPIRRFTLSAPVLQGAMSTHVLITGAQKRQALDQAADLPVDQAPIRTVLSEGTFHWSAE